MWLLSMLPCGYRSLVVQKTGQLLLGQVTYLTAFTSWRYSQLMDGQTDVRTHELIPCVAVRTDTLSICKSRLTCIAALLHIPSCTGDRGKCRRSQVVGTDRESSKTLVW